MSAAAAISCTHIWLPTHPFQQNLNLQLIQIQSYEIFRTKLFMLQHSNSIIIFNFFFPYFASVPITSVQGILARQALLPCDINPLERDDAVCMVLWFREGDGEPLYRFVYILCK